MNQREVASDLATENPLGHISGGATPSALEKTPPKVRE